ncbi:hypothetical protein PSEUDO8AS_10367 [Pseudomonas sp. 8AS]|nr:hypothetical protein PSEUDO8AS_10367 [Pseudomonas sp. 8AS]
MSGSNSEDRKQVLSRVLASRQEAPLMFTALRYSPLLVLPLGAPCTAAERWALARTLVWAMAGWR